MAELAAAVVAALELAGVLPLVLLAVEMEAEALAPAESGCSNPRITLPGILRNGRVYFVQIEIYHARRSPPSNWSQNYISAFR